jgi:hypothetical protein
MHATMVQIYRFNICRSSRARERPRVPMGKPNLMVDPLPFEKALDTPLFNYNDFIVIIFFFNSNLDSNIIPEIYCLLLTFHPIIYDLSL